MTEPQMIFDLRHAVAPLSKVGGKSASLMKLYSTESLAEHVPGGYALSVDFFNPWVDKVMASAVWKDAEPKLLSPGAQTVCEGLKTFAKELPLSPQQGQVLKSVSAAINSWPGRLAAVRSSTPEEDGTGLSFAGVFETKLGVTVESLEGAVRECFVSVFDYRVFSYAGAHRPAFAATVMEMVDSYKAGVAFSANPLNSDLDEMMVDSSWGLGESVVDGSVVADRFIWNKYEKRLVEKKLGSKVQERRLLSNGGVEVRSVDEARQTECSLSEKQLAQLAHLVGLVERTYGMPMDIEWAYTEDGQLRLLQARPITTIHPLDPKMLTEPGKPRVLYYDFNVASEATTTSPFTHMDLTAYFDICFRSMGFYDAPVVPEDPNQLYFNGTTRPYINLSHLFRLPFSDPETLANGMDMVDAYLASIFRGDECSKERYKSARLPRECTLYNMFNLLRKFRIGKEIAAGVKCAWDPIATGEQIVLEKVRFTAKLKELKARGPKDGLKRHCEEICEAGVLYLHLQMAAIWHVLRVFKSLDDIRRNGNTEKEREEADALCGGFVGDPLIELNGDMYNLARQLPAELWNEYDGRLCDLAERITDNVKGNVQDLPKPFVNSWVDFMDKHGYDGTDQLFVSSPRYHEQPEILLTKLRHNIGDIMDPRILLQERMEKRQAVQKAQEQAAGWCTVRKIRRRNLYLDRLMWIRNAPKLVLSEILAVIRTAVLDIEAQLIKAGRLDKSGDVFHVTIDEVDQALTDLSMDLRQLLAPRKKLYFRAKQAKTCPLLIDSRCRILKPNVVESEPGTLVGAALSPGVATGTVRVLTSPEQHFETGEVIVTVLTDPTWTPLFVCCSAVILQIGGALQHGALCAREYGKPAVSGIDVMNELTTGMRVSVDGNTGIIKILDKVPQRRSRSLTREDLGTMGLNEA